MCRRESSFYSVEKATRALDLAHEVLTVAYTAVRPSTRSLSCGPRSSEHVPRCSTACVPASSDARLVHGLRGLQLRHVGLDPPQHLDELLVLLASVVLDEAGRDRRGEQREEADADEHQRDPDDPSLDGGRVEVAVADGGDGRDRPPDAVPEGEELAACEAYCAAPARQTAVTVRIAATGACRRR